MLLSKQIKRRLSESLNSDLPKQPEILSPLSDTELKQSQRDEDLVSAAEALTRLTNSASPTPSFRDEYSASLQIVSPLSSTSLQDMGQQIHPIVQHVNTISRLPLVTNAVKYYETSKRNYATFNYAAGIVEKAAMPVFNKIEVNLNNKHQAKLEEKARLKKKRRVQKGNDKHEIRKRIKFCLHILKLANENISAKVIDLQEKIKDSNSPSNSVVKKETPTANTISTELPQAESHSSHENRPVITNVPEKTLETNNEIVATVKKIVHVISNFRPSSLNVGDAESDGANNLRSDDVKLKKTIRDIILRLPKQVSHNVPGAQKAPNQAISFARESLEMIGRLTTVFNEQLEKAEDWVDRSTESKTDNPSESNSPAASERTVVQRPGIVRLKSEDSFHSLQ